MPLSFFFEVRRIGGKLVTGQDPEMSPDNQIISQVSFLSIESLKKENPLQIHGVFSEY